MRFMEITWNEPMTRQLAGLLTISLLGTFGCGAIMNGRTQTVFFNSTPSGARIKVNGINRGETPAQIALERKQQYSVELLKDGYETYRGLITKNWSGWSYLSWLCCGFIGAGIDAATGGAYKLQPNSVYSDLKSKEPAPVSAER